jgi:hypothetical protein
MKVLRKAFAMRTSCFVQKAALLALVGAILSLGFAACKSSDEHPVQPDHPKKTEHPSKPEHPK